MVKPVNGNTLFRISNILGEVVFEKSIDVIPGMNRFELNIEELSQGMYFIHAGTQTLRFVVR